MSLEERRTVETEHSLAVQAGNYRRWSRKTRAERSADTAAAREGMWKRFLDEVDPERKLPEDERHEMAAKARKAFLAEMSLKSVRARRKAREAAEEAARAELAEIVAREEVA